MSRSLLQLVVRQAEGLVSSAEADEDAALLQRFVRTREEAAFAELLRRHAPLVWAVCRQSLPDAADAEDAFQATFLVLIRSPESVRNGGAFASWLHGVAVRIVGKLKRAAVRRKQREARVADREVDASVPECRWEELISAVHEEVQRLPADLRTAFVLCELEGRRQPEVATELGCKPGTLTSRLTRARQRLIERLSARGLAPAAFGTLGLSVATATAQPPLALVEATLSLLSVGEAVSPTLLALAHTVKPMTRMKLLAATLLVACGIGSAFVPGAGALPAAANPVVPIEAAAIADEKPKAPSGLAYVPHDAALFAHVDFAELWNGKLGKSIRVADAKLFEELTAAVSKSFGVAPADVKTATLFVPTMKKEPALGIVLDFHTPYDKAKLAAGLKAQVPGDVKTEVVAVSETTAVLLVNLDGKKYGQPQPADAKGPLTATLRKTAAGKHLIAAGCTLENMPNDLLQGMIRDEFRSFVRADSISAFIDAGTDVRLELHVNAANEDRAKESGQSVVELAKLLEETFSKEFESLKAAGEEKEFLGFIKALHTSMKGAKVSVEGRVARGVATLPADTPFAVGYLTGKRKVTDASARARSTNNLKQIAIAMHNYHEVMGTLPPAAVCDKTGKPLLSWRVLILPYIEQEALYKKFKLDEPWDSEHNKKLIATMPRVYADPSSEGLKPNETTYRVFVGNGSAFSYLKGAKLTEFKDGTSNTFLVATGKDGVAWTKPDELEFDPEKDATKLLGFPGGVCAVSMADGSVRVLAKSIAKKTVHAAITASGGEAPE